MRRWLPFVTLGLGALGGACSEDELPLDVEPEAGVDASVVVDAASDTRVDDADATVAEEVAVDAAEDAWEAPPPPPPVAPPDFEVPGTQMADLAKSVLGTSPGCAFCHAGGAIPNGPYNTWRGSLMAWAGRDPLFNAQLATAMQDVPSVGYYCVRCHVPMAVVSGHAAKASESAWDDADKDGVNCHFCHSMVDPVYVPGESPEGDDKILAALKQVPKTVGNAQFVIDPAGLRRGPYVLKNPYHPTVQSPFIKKSELCGTCHEVGNPAITRLADGTWFLNAMGAPAPDADPHTQFPLERTYSEWKQSAFAKGGVSMKGRFGGEGADVVSTCQDCHMPVAKGRGCNYGLEHDDLRRHDFAGASSWVLRAIEVDHPEFSLSLQAGAKAAEAMVQRAATLSLSRKGSTVTVQVFNQSGHKLPTGHIEGRRVFLSVQALDSAGKIVKEWGRWDPLTGDLDEASTTVFEMQVGLSLAAASVTGLPAGTTTHMSLANVIVKDNRIPPLGFTNAAFEAVGAPVVGARYADGQNWASVDFAMPPSAKLAKVVLYYQTVTRHYIEALRDGNETDDWGKHLHELWEKTGKGAPVAITSAELALP